jgi:hypothetical protein
MRFKLSYGLTAIVMSCLAIPAFAQPPGQPGQRGERGRGGPPGGGGMFFGGGGGGFTSRLSLLRIMEVRKELELADEQVAEIEKLDEELRAKYPIGRGPGGPFGPPGGPGGPPGGERGRRGGTNEGALRSVPTQWYFVQQVQQPQPGQPGQRGERGRGGFGGFQPPSPEQQAEMEKMRAERDREAATKLADILLPHQVKRLNEIFVQVSGTGALMDEEVGKQLGISAAQKAKMGEIRQQNQDAMAATMREMFQAGGGGGGGDRDANRAKFEEMRKANEAKVVAVLSADQQKKFEEMKGKPFAMPEMGRGGPGGAPGGPGRGPGGGRPPGNNN